MATTKKTLISDVAENRPASMATQLRTLLTNGETEFLMEAHDGLSAKIVQEAGFRGIWASGLTMSAALGVRDSNEASWTQVLEVLEFMSDAVSIPILVDGDTGYGNFNNVRRVVRKLGQRGIAGICLEDKLFPKTNSFIGDGQPLADADEFCGKIKAAKDTQDDPDFCVVARIEALIAGRGMDEALRRAALYHEAGADALLIHSKQRTPDEVLAFLKEWNNRSPVVIVPTTYYATPTETWREAGVSTVIWANHNLRASITAMRAVSEQIARDQSLAGVENGIATVKDVFSLAGNAELAEAEKRYLPVRPEMPRALILAASRGAGLGDLTRDIPKCMLDIRGKPLLRRLVDTLSAGGLFDITVVRGYAKSRVDLPTVKTVDNDEFNNTGEAVSLARALEGGSGDCVVSYGDVLFREYIVDRLLSVDGDIVIAADALWQQHDPDPKSRTRDLVACADRFSAGYLDDDTTALTTIGPDLAPDAISGEWIGIARFSGEGAAALHRTITDMEADGTLNQASMIDIFNALLDGGHEIRTVYVTGHWLDIDNPEDLARAQAFI